MCQVSSPPLCGDLIAEHASAGLGPAAVLPLAAGARHPVAESRQQVVEGLAEVVREEGVEDRVHATETIRSTFRRNLLTMLCPTNRHSGGG